MKSQTLRLCLIAALSCASAAAMAENPFAGTWKIDYSKSHVTGETISFTSEADGKVRFTEPDGSYTFKPDGSNGTNDFNQTVQWKEMDAHTWKAFPKAGSMVVTETWTLGDGEKTLTVATSGTRPNGQQEDATETYTRVGPGKGFFGKWKSTKLANNTPTTRQFEANGDDGVIWNIPEIKASVNLKFDGKDVAPTGPTVPNGLTLAATKAGPRSFELVEKMNGKVIFKARLTVSADGKTLTEVGAGVGSTVPERLVYNKAA